MNVFTIEQMSFHTCENLRLIWVLQGTLEVRVVGSSNKLTEGMIEVININEPVEFIGDKDNKVLVIEMAYDKCNLWYEDIAYRVLNINMSSIYQSVDYEYVTPYIMELKKRMVSMITDYMDHKNQKGDMSDVHMKEVVSYLVDHFDDIIQKLKGVPSISSEHIERFSDIDRYLLMNSSQRITLKDVTNFQFLSSQYLSAEFQKKLNHSFSRIIEHYRIVNVIKMFVDGQMTISEIIKNSGYSSDKYFYKAFRKYFDCTPKALKNRIEKRIVKIDDLGLEKEFQLFLRKHDCYKRLETFEVPSHISALSIEKTLILGQGPYQVILLKAGEIENITSSDIKQVILIEGDNIHLKTQNKEWQVLIKDQPLKELEGGELMFKNDHNQQNAVLLLMK